jgi:GNS1/SUR4 family
MIVVNSSLSDMRAKTLPLMDTPLPTAVFIVLYLAWVVVLGPFFMRDKKPFNLRNTLIYYNAFQVSLSAYMFYEVSWFEINLYSGTQSPKCRKMLIFVFSSCSI